MGLEHRLQQYPNQLSAGERQRAAIARSLANDPEILLADEPTGNLDSENSDKIMALLTGIQAKRNMVLVVVTHEAAVAQMAQRTHSPSRRPHCIFITHASRREHSWRWLFCP